MRHSCIFLVLLFAAASASPLLAQDAEGEPEGLEGAVLLEGDDAFELELNDPNPFELDMRIPFRLTERVFSAGSPAKATMRVVDVLLQHVATPVAVDSAGTEVPVADLAYPAPGRYEAYWDGTDDSGSPVASGVYLLELTVNGASKVIKMLVRR